MSACRRRTHQAATRMFSTGLVLASGSAQAALKVSCSDASSSKTVQIEIGEDYAGLERYVAARLP